MNTPTKVAVVTGGARGQGAAHAHRLASEGCRVYAADVLDEAIDQAALTLAIELAVIGKQGDDRGNYAVKE